MQLNQVGESDGELALWIDGQPVSHLGPGFPRGRWTFDKFVPRAEGDGVALEPGERDRESFTTAPGGDPFEGFRWRTAEPLNVNFLWLYLYITDGSRGHVNQVWYDDVVVATDYIGPLRERVP